MTNHYRIAKTALAATMLTSSGAALAQTTVYAARTEAQANSAAHQGPNVAGSNAHYVNGAPLANNSFVGPGGSISGSGSTIQTSVQSTQPGGVNGNVLSNTAFASADLATGQLKATTSSSGPENFGSPAGGALARLDDTIFFTNTSGSMQTISFTYTFDGQMQNPFLASANGNPGGYVSLGLSCGGNIGACYNGSNGTGQAITFATASGTPVSLFGGPRMPEDNWNYYFNYQNTGGNCFGENIFCGTFSSSLWEYGLNAPSAGGVVDGYIRAYLNIPTGQTSLGVRGTLNLDCRTGSSCDFGNTGQFGFGALPAGLSYGSASGVFLTANTTPPTTPGAVPEPASWALMIIGFGMIGGSIRSGRRVAIAA